MWKSDNESQFSIGEQSENIRKQLWTSDFKQCPMCKSPNIAYKRWPAGMRHNGDGYGTIVYQCLGQGTVNDAEDLEWNEITKRLSHQHGCGFFTSFQYDEAVSGDDRFETHGWTK